MTVRVFIGAPLARARHASIVAGALRKLFTVESTWHDNAGHRDPRDEDEREGLLADNLSAIDRSDVVIALVDDGRPRCTLFELGYAVRAGAAIVVVHDSGTGRFLGDSHARCVRLDLRNSSLEDLPRTIEIAAGLVAVASAERVTLPAPAPSNEVASG